MERHSKGANLGTGDFVGAGPANGNSAVGDPFSQYDWSAGMEAITNASITLDGDFWMGDAEDVSWLSTMPFAPGANNSWG